MCARFLACVSLLAILSGVSAQEEYEKPESAGGQTEGEVGYSIVFDAGSSKTQPIVYGFNLSPLKLFAEHTLTKRSVITDTKKFMRDLPRVIAECRKVIPLSSHRNTSLYIYATAGLRLESEEAAALGMDLVENWLSVSDNSPFQFRSARVTSGEEEGLFLWLAVNFLLGNLSDTVNWDQGNTVGILDKGGASSQIAFIPKLQSKAHTFPLPIKRSSSSIESAVLYTTSYLGLGTNEAIKVYKKSLGYMTAYRQTSPCLNPCAGCRSRDIDSEVGSGNFRACVRSITASLLTASSPCPYPEKAQCSIHNRYLAVIPKGQEFYATASYARCAENLGLLEKGAVKLKLSTLANATRAYCGKKLSKKEMDNPYIRRTCFQCSLGFATLTDGLHFNETAIITVANKINGREPTWTFGAVLYSEDKIGQNPETPWFFHVAPWLTLTVGFLCGIGLMSLLQTPFSQLSAASPEVSDASRRKFRPSVAFVDSGLYSHRPKVGGADVVSVWRTKTKARATALGASTDPDHEPAIEEEPASEVVEASA
eukprot:384452_1